MHGLIEHSIYTSEVNVILNLIRDDTSVKDSLFEQAQIYFETCDELAKARTQCQAQVEQLENLPTSKQTKHTQSALVSARQLLKEELNRQQQPRTIRHRRTMDILTKLLRLSESDSWDETQVASAKLLGNLQLLSPGEGAKLAQLNQKLKLPYKGVLALRLLDNLLSQDQITHRYITSRYQPEQRYSDEDGDLSTFQRDVALPVLVAAIFQDVGLMHPKAQLILKGKDGDLDENRVLEKEERLTLLKLNHHYATDYILYGLGMDQYVGNSKQERDEFEKNEKERLQFTRGLLKEALKPKQGLGNLIKVPQIYSSVVFSTKPTFSFADLPKASLVITKAAEGGAVSKVSADGLLAIVGHFPLGFGVVFIPKDEEGIDLDTYEYAIVTELNPDDPYTPKCRIATRNLTFKSNGQPLSVEIANNLYFSQAKKKLEKVSPERLEEILSKLASNFEERKDLELIPSFWNPYDFFSYKKLQNLWAKA